MNIFKKSYSIICIIIKILSNKWVKPSKYNIILIQSELIKLYIDNLSLGIGSGTFATFSVLLILIENENLK